MQRVLAMILLILVGWADWPILRWRNRAPKADAPPAFQPEPFWPGPLPENRILGQVVGIAVGPDDHIWLVHRPATLLDDEKGAQKNPPNDDKQPAYSPTAEQGRRGERTGQHAPARHRCAHQPMGAGTAASLGSSSGCTPSRSTPRATSTPDVGFGRRVQKFKRVN